MVLKRVAGDATAHPKSAAGTGLPCDPLPLYEAMQRRNLKKQPKMTVFRVGLGGENPDVVGEEFIAHLPAGEQYLFNCSACKHFMKQWGNLATVDPETGNLTPLFWSGAPPEVGEAPPAYYQGAVEAVAKLFVGKKVTHEFKVTKETEAIGLPESGGYMHMHFDFPSEMVEPKPMPGFSLPDASMLADMLSRVLEDYDSRIIEQTAHLLLDDKLHYANKHKGAIRYLRDLTESGALSRRVTDDAARHNLIYHYAASAFMGCLNALRGGAVGSLLSWVKDGWPFDAISSAWNEMAGPSNYMRPSAAPSVGNIASAEKLFADLGITKADLEREFLTSERIPENAFLWRRPVPERPPGLFSQVVPKLGKKAAKGSISGVPPTSISFVKFATTVLPKAEKIEYHLPKAAYAYFFVTGRPGTRPLMQWHDEANLTSWYTFTVVPPYNVNSYALTPGWTSVSQIISFPHMWDHPAAYYLSPDIESKPFKHCPHGNIFLVCLDGIHDNTGVTGLSLFPECMKREFHGVRSTIEAYSNANSPAEDKGMAPIGGIGVTTGEMKHMLRVTDKNGNTDMYNTILFGT
ncbi:hypothetical protein GP486_004278 [Trichoglossum hirsutum]|uniref:Uncharacterized protein n=1 Tax=Trichoglossum hirsutum TaxID=265104 RepID=A0A9P8LBG6_9PEZI|nr:hypothetical protein GP486_004278 [Trichoglossum hirsutum]